MSETTEEMQPKRKLVLGKDWAHAIKPNPKIMADSSIPGKMLNNNYVALLYDRFTAGRCCVGVYLKSCGVPDEILKSRSSAGSLILINKLPEEAKWLISRNLLGGKTNSEDAALLYEANDGCKKIFLQNITLEEFKEKQRQIIREVFGQRNVEVVFED